MALRVEVFAGLSGLRRTPTRVKSGRTSLRISSRLAVSSGKKNDDPVTLAPGRARLATSPVATASPATPITMGMVLVARLAASVPAGACVTNTWGFSRTNSQPIPADAHSSPRPSGTR